MSKARLFGHSLLWVFTVSISVLAVLIVAARFFLADVPLYKADLESYLSKEIGSDVRIAKMTAKMDGFQPLLSLTGITLENKENEASLLSIGEMRLSFSPFKFLSGGIKPTRISIIDTRIKIKRFDDGHLSIVGFSMGNDNDSSPVDFSWLLEGTEFEVIDSQITWQDDMRDLPDVTLQKSHITFQNNGLEHTLKMTANFPEAEGGSFVFAINVKGDLLSTNDWNAKGYFKGRDINVAKYLSRLKVESHTIKQGSASIELWSAWNKAQLSQVKGNAIINKAVIVKGNDELNVIDFNARFNWNKIKDGWFLQAEDFTFKTNNSRQDNSQLSVRYRTKKENAASINASANGINLEAIADILRYSKLLTGESAELLEKVRIRGQVNEANLSINQEGDQVAWGACGMLQGLSSNAYEKFPATNNLTATGCSTQAEGWLNINTKKGSVFFTTMFRDPIVIDDMDGQLTWQRDQSGWLINSDYIGLNSPHITSQTRVKVQLSTNGEPAVIDLQTNFGKAYGRFTPLYLPVGIMGDGLVDWLDNAFIEGEIKSCGLVLKGQLSEFPYREKQGAFQVLFEAQDVLLHYAEGWPNILGAEAEVEFKNEGMKILGSKGVISGNEIDHVFIGVSDLKYDDYLNIHGEIKDDISGLYTFFKQSPINEQVSALLAHSTVSGPAVIDLDIKIPLEEGLETQVNAKAKLDGNVLSFPDLDLAINNIHGVIHYDKRGISGQFIKGSVLGERIDVGINAKKNSTVISGASKLSVASLAKKYPSAFWKKINGSSDVTLKVNLPHDGLTGDAASTVTLKSNLQGVEVELPKPLGKKKKAVVPFEVVATLGQKTLPIQASYGDALKGVLLLAENSSNKKFEFKKADIHLGETPASLPKSKGIQLSGIMDILDVPEWKKALNTGKSSTSNDLVVNQLNLTVNKLHWLDRVFDNVHVIGEHKRSTWLGEVSSPVILGRFNIPDNLGDDAKISLNLDMLTLPSFEGGIYSDQESPLSPADIPNIDISSKQFTFGGSNLGQLGLKLRQKDDGMAIKELSLKSDRDVFHATGAWEVKGGKSKTGLNGKLVSKSLGELLKETGVTEKLKGAPVDVYFDLHWPGEPQAFSKKHVSGYAQIKSGEGRLLDVEPGIGRIFGLLSLNTLQRRLQLDFSDLVRKGLSFDKIKGRVVIVDGEAVTERLYLESPSARLDFAGTVSFVDEEIEQLITVTPKTTESLPLAGAIAGGPLVGAAVFIVQKIAGKTVNKLAGYQYRVTGPWKEPEIEQLSQPGGKIFGVMGDVLKPIFGGAKDR